MLGCVAGPSLLLRCVKRIKAASGAHQQAASTDKRRTRARELVSRQAMVRSSLGEELRAHRVIG